MNLQINTWREGGIYIKLITYFAVWKDEEFFLEIILNLSTAPLLTLWVILHLAY